MKERRMKKKKSRFLLGFSVIDHLAYYSKLDFFSVASFMNTYNNRILFKGEEKEYGFFGGRNRLFVSLLVTLFM